MCKIKVSKEAVSARKEWLLANSRFGEILDSDFYYQMIPSLDVCLYHINTAWLRERNINPIKIMKPDWRYLTCASIGFINPKVYEIKDWKIKYGSSNGVPRDESLLVS